MPTYSIKQTENEWCIRTLTYENQMFVCISHPGVSLIEDLRGNVEANLEANEPDVLENTVDMTEVTMDNHQKDRWPELYVPITDVEHPSKQALYEAPSMKDLE